MLPESAALPLDLPTAPRPLPLLEGVLLSPPLPLSMLSLCVCLGSSAAGFCRSLRALQWPPQREGGTPSAAARATWLCCCTAYRRSCRLSSISSLSNIKQNSDFQHQNSDQGVSFAFSAQKLKQCAAKSHTHDFPGEACFCDKEPAKLTCGWAGGSAPGCQAASADTAVARSSPARSSQK